VTKLLIVDDDAGLVELLGQFLAGEGFEVTSECDGERGARAAIDRAPDLVILDVMLPGLNGFEALRRIRERSAVPVVMLSARGEEVDRVVGLELGADDYLAKPFSPRELAARVRAVLRRGRSAGAPPPVPFAVGDLELDPGARSVRRAGEPVELTGLEFAILERLARDAGQVVRREALYREVLERRPSPLDRSLDVHLSALRRKLGAGADGGERIKTVRGVGYQYVRSEPER
jgi:two-component system response regulator CpxR